MIARTWQKLIKAFPSIDDDWLEILLDRVKGNDFTATELEAAVNRVIDTCTYPRPTVADIIQARPMKRRDWNELPIAPQLSDEERKKVAGRIGVIMNELGKKSAGEPLSKEEFEKNRQAAKEALNEKR